MRASSSPSKYDDEEKDMVFELRGGPIPKPKPTENQRQSKKPITLKSKKRPNNNKYARNDPEEDEDYQEDQGLVEY